MKKTAITIFSLLLPILVAAAEPGTEAMPFIRLPFSPVSMGAGAFSNSTVAAVPLGDDALACGAGWMSYMPEISRSDYISGGAAGKIGSLGLSLNFTRGAGQKVYGLDYRPSDILVNAGVGYAFLPNLSAGVNFSYAIQNFTEDYSSKAWAADIFLAGKFDRLAFTAGVSSIGSPIASEENGNFSLPSSASADISYLLPLAENHSLKAGAGLDYYFSGAAAGGLGLEYNYDKLVFVRAGYHFGGDSIIPSFASAGLGARLGNFELDAAYIFASDILKNSFSLGLVFHLREAQR